MENLSYKVISYLGRKPNFPSEVKLQNDGSGDYIAEWNISSEKAKPTDSQLNALASEATKLKKKMKFAILVGQLTEILVTNLTKYLKILMLGKLV